MENKKIALIIVNYKTYNFTISCVESIFENCNVNYHIYIVDNYSPNESVKILKEKYDDEKNVTIVESKRNLGYSDGLNQGYFAAKENNYDYYVFMNNDLLFHQDTFNNLIKSFNSHSNVGVIGGQIIDKEGNPLISYKKRLTFTNHLFSMKPFYYFKKKEKVELLNHVLELDGMVAGCFFAIDSQTMEILKEFDNNIFIYFEEDALSWRLKKIGRKCIVDPSILITHIGSQTIPRNAFTYFNRYKSALYVLRKYCGCSKFKLFIPYFIYKMNLLSKSFKDDQFKKALKDLKSFYKTL